MEERLDEFYFTIAKECGGIEGLLNSMFSFLLRRTDFYYESDPGDKMGFPPGVAANMLATVFKKYQDQHYKKHKPKSSEEYKKKLQIYQQQQQQSQQQQPQSQSQSQLQSQQQQQQQKQVEEQGKFNTYNGGDTDKYSWSQSGQDVVVGIELPQGVNKKQVKVIMQATTLLVTIKDEVIIDGKLYDRIKPDESVWSIEGSQLTLTLWKGNDNIWKTVVQGDKEIDATKVENSKPLEDFDPETQGALRKIMYEQQRKQQGLPTTDEEKQMDVLKKAWDAEGSPFKGTPFDPSKFNLGNGQMNF